MASERDTILLETVRTHRSRLISAMLYGELDRRFVANPNLRRMLGGLVVAALACAVCAGVSFVTTVIAEQQQASTSSTGTTR